MSASIDEARRDHARFCDAGCRDRTFGRWLEHTYGPDISSVDMPPAMLSRMREAYEAGAVTHPYGGVSNHDDWRASDQPKQPRFLIMMISATEERGIDNSPWRLSLDVPAGWRLVQVLPGTPAPEGRIACVLERVS